MIITENDLENQERFYRANLINSVSGFKPVSLIGTTNGNGVTNLSVFSNIFHLGADPALIGMINRPKASTTHTLNNIEANGSFTINHINFSFVHKAHQCSARYTDQESEFDKTGLTPVYHENIAAPFIKESRISIGLKATEIIPIKQNGTYLIIGAVQLIEIKDAIISEEGWIDLVTAGSMVSSGLDRYHEVKEGLQFPYAKP